MTARGRGQLMKACRPLLAVALVHGLLGWLYSAAWAAFRPNGLPAPISSWLPLRRDTFGICCFAASALAFFLLQLSGEQRPAVLPYHRGGGAVVAALRTLVVFPLLAWAYLCVNSLTHPSTIGWRLTHFASVPTEGKTAVCCYAISAVALLALGLREPRPGEGARHER